MRMQQLPGSDPHMMGGICPPSSPYLSCLPTFARLLFLLTFAAALPYMFTPTHSYHSFAQDVDPAPQAFSYPLRNLIT